MNKLLSMISLAAIVVAIPALAETISGEVLSVDGNTVVVKTNEGQKMTFQTTDKTTYRKKKLIKHTKKKRGMRGPNDWTFQPVAEEDDWVEITYNPKTGDGTAYEVDSVTVYDD